MRRKGVRQPPARRVERAAREFLTMEPPHPASLRTGGIGAALGAALVLLTAFFLSRPDPIHRDVATWAWLLAVPLVVLAYGGASIALWLFAPSRIPVVVVGSDGVLVRGRFVSYATIQSVDHRWSYVEDEAASLAYDNMSAPGMVARDVWTVSLGLVGGVIGHVVTLGYVRKKGEGRTEDAQGAEIVQAIEEVRLEWAAGQADPNRNVPGLSRGARTGAQWLEGLRQLGSGSASYRDGAVDLARLARLLDDEHAEPSVRAAAALVLAASGEREAVPRLRVAAEAMAHPRLRIALESIAAGRDDAAVVEALEALEEKEVTRSV
jgi:hypothetical protein